MGYIIDISAGGAALSTQENLNIQGADYIQCIRMGEDMALDLDGLLGQIVAVAPKEKEEESLVLHMSFFPYAQEKRREVISFVYAVEAGTAPTDQVQGTDGKLRDSSETANPSTPSTQ
jgi:c-di-GMP-binding flagellar brake protein YcgR